MTKPFESFEARFRSIDAEALEAIDARVAARLADSNFEPSRTELHDDPFVCPGVEEIPLKDPTPEQEGKIGKFETKEFPVTTLEPIIENGAKNALHPSVFAFKEPGGGVVAGPAGTGVLIGEGLPAGKEVVLTTGELQIIGERKMELITTTER